MRTFCLLLLAASPTFAAPFIEHLMPPVIERGKPTRVTFVGRELEQAVGVWHSGPTFTAKIVESTPTRTVAEITTDANVGITGVRLATKSGLSNLHLFLIDDLPVKSAAATVALPASVVGTFRPSEVDRYAIDVNAGQTVSFEVVGSRFGKDCDPLVLLRNAQGKLLAEHDSDQGLHYDTRFAYTFATAGTYTVEVREARFHGSPHHPYVLRMGTFLPARVALPNALVPGKNTLRFPEVPDASVSVEAPTESHGPFSLALKRPGDDGSIWLPLTRAESVIVAKERDPAYATASEFAASPATTFAFNLSPWRVNPFASLDRLLLTGRLQATPALFPGMWSGVLRQPAERQGFVFDMAKGQSLYLRADAKSLHSPADLDMILTDRTGREQRRAQEVREELHLDFTANNAGQYGLLLRDTLRDGGPAHTYRVTARTTPFPPTITADVEGLTVPQGSYQTVPLTITRTGTTGNIKLKLLHAPPGLMLTPDEIPEKENTLVCQLHATDKTPLGTYAVQLLAESSSGGTLVRTQPLIDKQIINVDLIPLALRDDQKRLPPALTDRVAVQVTPPAPFAFELSERTITLPRYQHAPIPLAITRTPGYTGAINFTAKGGQLAPKSEGRTRVYAEFPIATPPTNDLRGMVHSKILSNLGKVRVDVSATGSHEQHTVTLTRTFELNLTTAFTVTPETPKATAAPGDTVTVRLQATRVPTFTDAIALKLSPIPGLTFPETVTIAKGQTSTTFAVVVSPDITPNRYNVQGQAHGDVGGFEEELRVSALELEVRKPEPPKKK